MGAAVTKQELKKTLRDYPTKRDLSKAIGQAMNEQDKRFAKRIAESEAWSERVFATNERVDQLEGKMIRRFNEADSKREALFEAQDHKMEAMEQRIIGAMQAIVTQVTAKLTPKDDHRRLEKRVAVLERKST